MPVLYEQLSRLDADYATAWGLSQALEALTPRTKLQLDDPLGEWEAVLGRVAQGEVEAEAVDITFARVWTISGHSNAVIGLVARVSDRVYVGIAATTAKKPTPGTAWAGVDTMAPQSATRAGRAQGRGVAHVVALG